MKRLINKILNKKTYSEYKNGFLIKADQRDAIDGVFTIPNGITTVNAGAYNTCPWLKKVVMPDSVISIGNKAFNGCENLTKIIFSKNLKKIGDKAFNSCWSLAKVTLPDSIEDLGEGIFSYCYKLKECNLPKNISHIPAIMFMNSGLEEFAMPDTVTELEDSAFSFCEHLKNIKLSNNLKRIPQGCFYGCYNLKEIDLPESIESIGQAFSSCTKLETVTFPKKQIILHEGEGIFPTNIKSIKFGDKTFNISGNIEYINYFHAWYPFIRYSTIYDKKFIPSYEVVVSTSDEEIENFYKYSKNWKKILNAYIELWPDKKDLNEPKMNLYQLCVALGVFQDGKKGITATDFILKNIVTLEPRKLHQVYSGFATHLYGYQEEFAQFFMANFRKPKIVELNDEELYVEAELYFLQNLDEYGDVQSWAGSVYNNWEQIKKAYPNKTILAHRETGSENNSLTEEDVINAINYREYDNVNPGNEKMAELLGMYGYSDTDFDKLQDWWDKGKKIEKIIKICEDESNKKIKYTFMKKDDEEVLILGEKTNCCQTVDDAASSCVEYGVTKPNSGFLKFTYQDKIIGQSWVWYNPKTQVICLDNIEIPTIWKKKINSNKELEKAFLDCLRRFVINVTKTMREHDKYITDVTVGKGYNDLHSLNGLTTFTTTQSPLPEDYYGYSDADVQYIISDLKFLKNYEKKDDVTI